MDNILPAFNKNNIPIVLAMDDKYSKYTSVMLISLRNNANMTRNYDILIFHKDISFENQNKLKSIFKNCDNFSLRFIDLSEHLEGLKLPVFSYYSIEIYFRPFIPYILNEYTRVIYLDCDMIVKGDISELWKQSLDGNTIGAVRDYGMILHYYTKGKVYIPKEYFEKTLVGVNPDNYFNSGVLLIDTKKYKETYTLQYILDYAQKEKWHFPDQDLLNILFSGSTKIIPSKFNTVPNTSGDRNVDYLKRNIPIQYFNEYYEARNNPTIIHFAQREKPWKYTINLDYELFSYFWKYAAQTEYFMTLLYEIKRYTSLLEALHIAQTFLNNKIERKVSSENIVYICGKYCIGSYSEIVTRFEYCKLSEREIIVEGYTEVPFCEDPKSVNLIFMVNGTSYACSIFERYPIFFQKQYKNCIYGFPIGFRCRIPIDSCTERYEIFLTTVLDQIKMKNVHINYGMFFPVDRINKYQYYFSNNWILKAKGCLLRLERAGKRKRIKNEVKYLSSLLKNRTKYDYKSVICRIALFISNFMVHDKKIWIISDNFLADDNGIAFFRFLCQKKGKKCCPYFVVDKKQMQYYTIKKWEELWIGTVGYTNGFYYVVV